VASAGILHLIIKLVFPIEGASAAIWLHGTAQYAPLFRVPLHDADLSPGGLPIETASIDSCRKFYLNIVHLCDTHN
jgi:hypothetical protein